MNNKSAIWIINIVLISLISCKKETLPEISSFTASKGTYIGVVHLAIEEIPGAENYSIERKNPQTNQWEGIHWGSSSLWDDNGWGLPNNTLIPGQNYEYRARAHADDTGFNNWSETTTGYIFYPAPVLLNLSYALLDPQSAFYQLTCTIKDSIPTNIGNLLERKIYLYRSENTILSDYILYKSIDGANKDKIIIATENYSQYDPIKTYYYKLKIAYRYGHHRLTAENEIVWDETLEYIYESNIINGADVTN